MNKLKKLFKTERPVIGMIHFMPLMGYRDFAGIDKVLQKALKDLRALEKGGVGAILVENNYDISHRINVLPETIACMTYLTKEIVQNTRLPVGVIVLWNDYKAALSIAKVCGAKFVRVPVFVDKVRTAYGDITGDPEDVIKYRKSINAEDIFIFTDIHVKHATFLSKKTIEESAKEAIKKGSDVVIVTGKLTGDAPFMDDLRTVRQAIENFPLFVGSGADEKNVGELLRFADGVIVGTAVKTGRKQRNNVNIKSYRERIDGQKVKTFIKAFKAAIES